MIRQIRPFDEVENVGDFLESAKKVENQEAVSKADKVLKAVLPTNSEGEIDVQESVNLINGILDNAMGIQATSGLTPTNYALLKAADLIDKKVAKEHPTIFAILMQSKLPSFLINFLSGGHENG